ncbi:hypothetical protein GCM10010104_25510 [Streptomyces indiaensis]|uniref:Leucine-zipper of insertion element IS481 n=1 Tax=Streptomyces indiaensis TaxID=284033 RepID=A0ABN3DGX1_9ACTN
MSHRLCAGAAVRFQVSHTTAARWADRYRRHSSTSMHDRNPQHPTQTGKMPAVKPSATHFILPLAPA